MLKSILITGANAGLGKESARQLALKDGVEKIYLGCRNQQKAEAAKKELEEVTGKSIFEIVIMDVTDLASIKAAVASLKEPVEGLIMNAGGAGGPTFHEITKDGVTQTFAMNVLGHVVLAETLLAEGKLTKAAVYAGTEAIRGVPEMGIKQFILDDSSVDEFKSIANGSRFNGSKDPMKHYGPVKYVAALWMSTLARKYPKVKLVTMSPGATTGTEALSKVSFFKRLMFGTMFQVMQLLGKVHKLEIGAERYLDALLDDNYKSGVFYASKKGVTGEVTDQSTIFADLGDQKIQENANQAVHGFV